MEEEEDLRYRGKPLGRFTVCGDCDVTDECGFFEVVTFDHRIRIFEFRTEELWRGIDVNSISPPTVPSGQHVESSTGCNLLAYRFNTTTGVLSQYNRNILTGADSEPNWEVGGFSSFQKEDGTYHPVAVHKSHAGRIAIVGVGNWQHHQFGEPSTITAIGVQLRDRENGDFIAESLLLGTNSGSTSSPPLCVQPLSDDSFFVITSFYLGEAEPNTRKTYGKYSLQEHDPGFLTGITFPAWKPVILPTNGDWRKSAKYLPIRGE